MESVRYSGQVCYVGFAARSEVHIAQVLGNIIWILDNILRHRGISCCLVLRVRALFRGWPCAL